MWCWRRIDKISWTDHLRNEEALHWVKVEKNILQTIKRRKAASICNILHMNCLLKHLLKGRQMEVTGRRGRRRAQPLGDLKENRTHW
jgi:hypothetical protein